MLKFKCTLCNGFGDHAKTGLGDSAGPPSTFGFPWQRAAFLKLLRGRAVYDARDGGLKLASFRSMSRISLPSTTGGSLRVETGSNG